MKLIYKMNTTLSCCVLFLFFNACNAQSKVENCKENYKKANNILNAYYKNNDESLLNSALDYTEQAIKCDETRSQAIDKKISLLALLKNYKSGYEFVDSLDKSVFGKEYKKKMYSSFFRASEYQSQADTANAHALYLEVIRNINEYIESNTKGQKQLDEEAYYDLFFVKSKILSGEEISNELDSLRKAHPSAKDFFMTLKSSFVETAKEVSPVRQ